MNTITIELCAEDRARLDRLQALLDRLASKGVLTITTEAPEPAPAEEQIPGQMSFIENHTEAPAEAPAEEPVEADTIPAEEEKPAEVKSEPAEAIDFDKVRAEVQSLVVRLSASGKKEQARVIVQAYASRVSAIPEDKLIEAKDKLTALEG